MAIKTLFRQTLPQQMILGLITLALLLPNAVAESGTLYRYIDAQGGVVLNDHIPPEMIDKGYSILNAYGQVVKVIPRSLTAAEIEAREGSKEERVLKAKVAVQQEKSDQRLLTIFSHPKDAERARERKIEALDVIISINLSNIASLRSEGDVAQAQAAGKERSGQTVPTHLLEKIERIDRQISKLEGTNSDKEQEKAGVRQSYAKDIARLKVLIQQGRK